LPKYRKKPVVIEALQFKDNPDEVVLFLGGYHAVDTHRVKSNTFEGGYIKTLEGEMEYSTGDWIIKGIKGEFYFCKPDIFDATYELCD
jgi:hypothetical protein